MQDLGETLAAIADKLLTLVCKWLRAGHIRALEWARAACALRTQPRAAAICAETTQAGRAEHTRADHRTEAGAAIATPTLAVSVPCHVRRPRPSTTAARAAANAAMFVP